MRTSTPVKFVPVAICAVVFAVSILSTLPAYGADVGSPCLAGSTVPDTCQAGLDLGEAFRIARESARLSARQEARIATPRDLKPVLSEDETPLVQIPPTKKVRTIDHFRDGPARVFGMTEKEALILSNDEHGSACTGPIHDHGDMANRWCHASVSKFVSALLREGGSSRALAGAAGLGVFVAKEYGFDRVASPSDIVLADFELYDSARSPRGAVRRQRTFLGLSVFGDGATFFNLISEY